MKKVLLAAVLTCCSGAYAQAATTYTLDPVIVTATATPVESQMKTQAAVSVISKEDIETKHYKNMVDVLEDIPGVQTMTPANGIGFEVSGYAQPTMRGISRIVFLIDGVKQDFGGRSYSANMIRNMDDVERIEVVRGTSSVLYGAEAVGGVVNIITKKHYEKQQGKLTMSVGNFKSRNIQLDHSGESGKSFWAVTGLYNSQGDYKDGNGRHLFQDVGIHEIDLKYGYHLNDRSRLTFKYVNHYQGQDYVEGRGNGYVDPTFGWLRYNTFSATWDYKGENGKWVNSLSFYRGEIESDRYEDEVVVNVPGKSNYGTWSERFKKISTIVQDNYYNQLSKNNRISAGFEFIKRDLYTLASKYSSAESYATEKDGGFYLQDEWQITDKLKFVAGGRYAYINVGQNKFLPSFDLGYTFSDHAMVYASSKGFMYYSSMNYYAGNETSNCLIIKNNDLKPLTGTTNEIGAKFRIGKNTYFDISYFDRKEKDTLAYRDLGKTSSGKIIRQYYNISNPLHVKGLEMNLSKRFSDYFKASLFYSHISAERENQISNMAKDTYGIELKYMRDTYDIGLNGLGRYHIQRSTGLINKKYRLPYESFWVWNLFANYKVNDSVRLWTKVNNLFNKMYAYTPDFDSKWNMPREYICPGRSFLIGVECKF